MISIRRRMFLMNVPFGITIVVLGILMFTEHSRLNETVAIIPAIVAAIITFAPVTMGYGYIIKNKSKFEPFDELATYNELQACYILILIVHTIFLLIAGIIIFIKPQIEYWQVSAGIDIVLGVIYILKYVIFLIIEKRSLSEV